MNEKEDVFDLISEELGEIAEVRRYLCDAYEALEDVQSGLIPPQRELLNIATPLGILNRVVTVVENEIYTKRKEETA
jgi:hypothetical protein